MTFRPIFLVATIWTLIGLVFWCQINPSDSFLYSEIVLLVENVFGSLQTDEGDRLEINEHILLWWTLAYNGEISIRTQCNEVNILITTHRSFLKHPKLKAILFYGSDIDLTDLPLPRNGSIPWALLHEESPKNAPFLSQPKGIALFNWTSTFSRHSTFPLAPISLHDFDELLDIRYLVPLEQKNTFLLADGVDKLSPIAYVQSICNAMSGRDEYVSDLMRFIDVDSYGECLHNREMPDNLSGQNYISSIQSPAFYEFLARYKFVIAFENSVCEDYITEKLWRPLRIGVIPIYFGAPNVQDWLPFERAAVLVRDFDGPQQLAAYIHYLNNNDTAYNEFTTVRQNKVITNEFLLDVFRRRKQTSLSYQSFFERFECSVAIRSSGQPGSSDTEIADQSHYPCAESALEFAAPEKISSETSKKLNKWKSIWKQAAYEADVLDELVRLNVNYTRWKYGSLLSERLRSDL